MTATAQITPDLDGQEERQLASDIATAMQYRPLMSRLSRGEPVPAAAPPSRLDDAPAASAGIPDQFAKADVARAEPALDPRSIEEILDDLSCPVTAPPSAAWLDRACHEQRENRKRHALAWVTTCVIALGLVVPALVLLRA
jgi:hypothetical protein